MLVFGKTLCARVGVKSFSNISIAEVTIAWLPTSYVAFGSYRSVLDWLNLCS